MLKRCIYLIFITVVLYSCTKKAHPSTGKSAGENTDTIAVKKTVKRRPKEPVPKVISVSDSGAHKTVDGRYYYDLQGHRYWKNNKDGKYYLFNKSMYTNEDFKPVNN